MALAIPSGLVALAMDFCFRFGCRRSVHVGEVFAVELVESGGVAFEHGLFPGVDRGGDFFIDFGESLAKSGIASRATARMIFMELVYILRRQD